MTITRLTLTLGFLALFTAHVVPNARADQWDKKTILTINESIQVPNRLLPSGKYVFKLLNSPSDRHIVQMVNSEETESLTTILAIPNHQLKLTDKSRFLFWETPSGQPKAYVGNEFAYPKSTAVTIAAETRTEVPSTEAKEEPALETAAVEEVAPPVEAAAPPAPTVEVAEAPAPAPPAPVEAPPELPKTASPYPLIGLIGLFSPVFSLTLRLIRIR